MNTPSETRILDLYLLYPIFSFDASPSLGCLSLDPVDSVISNHFPSWICTSVIYYRLFRSITSLESKLVPRAFPYLQGKSPGNEVVPRAEPNCISNFLAAYHSFFQECLRDFQEFFNSLFESKTETHWHQPTTEKELWLLVTADQRGARFIYTYSAEPGCSKAG